MNLTNASINKPVYIGLMSGTSMDGIDAVLVDFSAAKPQLLHTCSIAIPRDLKLRLLRLCESVTQPELSLLDSELGELFAKTTMQLLHQSKFDAASVCAIGSHGQTVFHQPPSAEIHGSSLQIGDPNIIALRTGITTVADFRRKDMAAGGHGAPLVPAFHNSVFRSSEKNRVIVNIGGMANITVLPKSGNVTGFDTGPGNVLIDSWISQQQNLGFDNNGNWASQGKIDNDLLACLLNEKFFSAAPPKSTGRELFNTVWLEKKLAAYGNKIPAVDVQATLCALTASSIATAIKAYGKNAEELFVCGGGANNGHLMGLIGKLTGLNPESTSTLGVDPCQVEATAFAWLAKQTIEGKTGNLPDVTGAKKAVVLGGIYLP